MKTLTKVKKYSIMLTMFIIALNVSAKDAVLVDSSNVIDSTVIDTVPIDSELEFKGEIFRSVLSDSFVQYRYKESQNRQTNTVVEEKENQSLFLKSFGMISYQGVVETEHHGKYHYQTTNDEIFWKAFSDKSTHDYGYLNMNSFLQENHSMLSSSEQRPWWLVAGAVGFVVGATCAWLTSDCTTRCASVTCPSGSTKVCESSCLTGYCGVACNHMEPDSNFNPPWAGGGWSSPFWQWSVINTDENGIEDDGISVIGK